MTEYLVDISLQAWTCHISAASNMFTDGIMMVDMLAAACMVIKLLASPAARSEATRMHVYISHVSGEGHAEI